MSEIKRTGSTGSMMTIGIGSLGSSTPSFPSTTASTGHHPFPSILVKIFIPFLKQQKALRVQTDDTIWSIKAQIMDKMATELDDALNYGVYLPGVDGKEGKFLDEPKLVSRYRLENGANLEFRLKHKMGYNPSNKGYAKENNPKTQKKLMELVKEGKVEDVKQKIGRIMDPNFLSEDGRMIIFIAAPQKILISVTPLVQAVLNNDRDMINALIEAGAIIDYRTKWGCFNKNGTPSVNAVNSFSSSWLTPIHVAASENKLVALQTLMYYGASPNVKDSESISPLSHACVNDHLEIARWILIWAGVNSKEGTLALDLEQKDSQNQTVLLHACSSASPQVIQILCEWGADISVACKSDGNTPLHVVCGRVMNSQGNKECADILMSFGADREVKNLAGQVPAQTALMSGNMELCDFVKKWTIDKLRDPQSLDQLVDTSRVQWANIKKMMAIGTTISKIVTNLSSSSQASIDSNQSEERDVVGSVRSLTSPLSAANGNELYETLKSVTSSEACDDGQSSISSISGISGVKTETAQSRRASSRQSVMGVFQQPNSLSVSQSVPDISAKLPSPSFAAPPQSALSRLQQPLVFPSMGSLKKNEIPPPPPGEPPVSLANLNVPQSSVVDMLEKLQKIEMEKRKVAADIEHLRNVMLKNSQLKQEENSETFFEEAETAN